MPTNLTIPPRRKSIRLSGYDYSEEGSYFITIVTKNRESLFGTVENGEMRLNNFGRVVEMTWNDLTNHNSDIGLDEFVIMPNHVHGIIHIFPAHPVGAGSAVFAPGRVLCATGKPALSYKPALSSNPVLGSNSTPTIGAGYEPAPTKTPLSEIVRQFKTFSARRINSMRSTAGSPVWQRNYYDHIIGTDREYEQISTYIVDNPQNWFTDQERLE